MSGSNEMLNWPEFIKIKDVSAWSQVFLAGEGRGTNRLGRLWNAYSLKPVPLIHSIFFYTLNSRSRMSLSRLFCCALVDKIMDNEGKQPQEEDSVFGTMATDEAVSTTQPASSTSLSSFKHEMDLPFPGVFEQKHAGETSVVTVPTSTPIGMDIPDVPAPSDSQVAMGMNPTGDGSTWPSSGDSVTMTTNSGRTNPGESLSGSNSSNLSLPLALSTVGASTSLPSITGDMKPGEGESPVISHTTPGTRPSFRQWTFEEQFKQVCPCSRSFPSWGKGGGGTKPGLLKLSK